MNYGERETALRGLLIFFVVLMAGSAFIELKILQTGKPIDRVPLFLIVAWMYTPAAASVLARLALHEGFGDVSFRWGSRESGRVIWLAWGYPLAVGLVAYGVAWATGLAEFQPPLSPRSHLYVGSAARNLLASLFLSATLGTALNCFTAFGEELGWRGYMLTRLVMVGVPRPVFVSGLVWALWHVPVILSGQYAAGSRPRLSATLFVIHIVADAYVAAYLRFRTGSVWPAVTMHGAWNAVIQGTFDRATKGTPQAVGESGWLTMIVSIAFVVAVTRGVWILQRRPGKPLTLLAGSHPSLLTL